MRKSFILFSVGILSTFIIGCGNSSTWSEELMQDCIDNWKSQMEGLHDPANGFVEMYNLPSLEDGAVCACEGIEDLEPDMKHVDEIDGMDDRHSEEVLMSLMSDCYGEEFVSAMFNRGAEDSPEEGSVEEAPVEEAGDDSW